MPDEIAYPVANSSGGIWTASGEFLCDCPGGGDDARRVVALLNACRDIPTEDLEYAASRKSYTTRFMALETVMNRLEGELQFRRAKIEGSEPQDA